MTSEKNEVDRVIFEMREAQKIKMDWLTKISAAVSSSSTSSPLARTIISTIFKDALYRNERACSHLESLSDCLDLCPPARFLAWALGHDAAPPNRDPRGIWMRLWVNELAAAVSSDSNSRKHINSSSSKGYSETIVLLKPTNSSENTCTSTSTSSSSSSLQALEIECLERIRRILSPIEMIRFCVWANQNRLTMLMFVSESSYNRGFRFAMRSTAATETYREKFMMIAKSRYIPALLAN
eukprot:jgi/Bigna1/138093/aug1.42_g12801